MKQIWAEGIFGRVTGAALLAVLLTAGNAHARTLSPDSVESQVQVPAAVAAVRG